MIELLLYAYLTGGFFTLSLLLWAHFDRLFYEEGYTVSELIGYFTSVTLLWPFSLVVFLVMSGDDAREDDERTQF